MLAGAQQPGSGRGCQTLRGEQAGVGDGETRGFHWGKACAPLSRAVGSQPLRAPGPWAGRVPAEAELWPQRGGLSVEGVARERCGEQAVGAWSPVQHPVLAVGSGVWPLSRLHSEGAYPPPSQPPGVGGGVEMEPPMVPSISQTRLQGGGVGGWASGRARWGSLAVARAQHECGEARRPWALWEEGPPWGRSLDRPRDDVFVKMGV